MTTPAVTIGCAVCWIDPKITDIEPAVAIFDGNGYCKPHMQEAVKFLARLPMPQRFSYSTSLPMVLANVAGVQA